MKRQSLDDFEDRTANKKGRVIKDITKIIEAKPAAKPDYIARYAPQAHCAHGMHQACDFLPSNEPTTADLNAALAKITAQHAPALTDAQKGEMLASDTALRAACEAFNLLNDQQKEAFAQITGAKFRKTAEKKAKAEIDPATLKLAIKIFQVGSPSPEQYEALAAAKAGIMPEKPSFADKKAEIYHQVMKSASTKRIFAAVESRDLDALRDQLDLTVSTHTANRIIKAYGLLAEIAIASQKA